MPSKKRTTEEKRRIINAIAALTDADVGELVDYARFRASSLPMDVGEDADDLAQTVLLKALMAHRGCAIDVDPEAFLKNAIKSVANQQRKSAFAEAAHRNEFRHYRARCAGAPDTSRQIARNIVAAVRAELRDDAEALDVLESMLDEKPPRDACRDFGMERNAYNAVRKRIARRTRHAAAIATAGFGRTGFYRHRPS